MYKMKLFVEEAFVYTWSDNSIDHNNEVLPV
jgi:hypothetical protein